MKNFDIDLTQTERDTVLTRWAAITSTATVEQLRVLVLDLLNIVLNDPQMDADDRNFSRSIDPVTGKPRDPEYAHEFLMRHDSDYYNAWAYQHSESFKAYADETVHILDSVIRGQERYTYFESDPDIVWRSLLRSALRQPEEGEEYPPEVLGRTAPDNVIVIPMLAQHTYGSTGDVQYEQS